MSVPQHHFSDEEHAVGDRAVVEYLRRQGAATVQDLVDYAGVTATAIRQRLTRLMDQGLIVRESESVGRGRPTHRYSLSEAGVRSSGTNYEDLVGVLWTEIRAVKDPDVRYGLLKRIVVRLAELYRDQIKGESVNDRMESLVELMRGRDIPFEVIKPVEGQLPVLKALACPYPSLAEQDRSICSMEKMLFAEILGSGLRLSDCRLDGAAHCTFDMNPHVAASV
jgi:predicted ArsR family transcriptional regulator